MRILFSMPMLVAYFFLALMGSLWSGAFQADCAVSYEYIDACKEWGDNGIGKAASDVLGLFCLVIGIIIAIAVVIARFSYVEYISKMTVAAARVKVYEEQVAGIKANIADLKEFNADILANTDTPVASQMRSLSKAQKELADCRNDIEVNRGKKIEMEIGPFSGVTKPSERDQFKVE